MNSLDSPWYRFHECEDPQYVIQSAFIFRCSFCIQFCYAGCEINKNIVHIKVQAFHHITLCGSYCRNTNIMILQFTCKLPCESYPEIEHSLNMKNVCLISIHTNAAGNGRQWMNARGWCCYTSRGQTALPPACMKQLPSTFQAISFGKTIPTEIPTGNPTSTS